MPKVLVVRIVVFLLLPSLISDAIFMAVLCKRPTYNKIVICSRGEFTAYTQQAFAEPLLCSDSIKRILLRGRDRITWTRLLRVTGPVNIPTLHWESLPQLIDEFGNPYSFGWSRPKIKEWLSGIKVVFMADSSHLVGDIQTFPKVRKQIRTSIGKTLSESAREELGNRVFKAIWKTKGRRKVYSSDIKIESLSLFEIYEGFYVNLERGFLRPDGGSEWVPTAAFFVTRRGIEGLKTLGAEIPEDPDEVQRSTRQTILEQIEEVNLPASFSRQDLNKAIDRFKLSNWNLHIAFFKSLGILSRTQSENYIYKILHDHLIPNSVDAIAVTRRRKGTIRVGLYREGPNISIETEDTADGVNPIIMNHFPAMKNSTKKIGDGLNGWEGLGVSEVFHHFFNWLQFEVDTKRKKYKYYRGLSKTVWKRWSTGGTEREWLESARTVPGTLWRIVVPMDQIQRNRTNQTEDELRSMERHHGKRGSLDGAT